MIAQSGKYDELLEAESGFSALVAAHDSSMELVEQSRQVEETEHSQSAAVLRKSEYLLFAPDPLERVRR